MRTKKQVDFAARAVFTAPNRAAAEPLLQLGIATSEKTALKLAHWMEANVVEGLAIFKLPIEHCTRCRTINALERLNKEIARRTRVATLFPNEDSLLRLVTAVIGEIDEDWATGKIYLTIKP